MCHVPQSHEAMLFGLDSVKSLPAHEGTDHTVKSQQYTYPALFLNYSHNSLSIVLFLSHLYSAPCPSLLSQGSQDAERGLSFRDKCLGPVSETVSSVTVHCVSWIKKLYEFYTAPVVKFWFHTVGGVHVVTLVKRCKTFPFLG